MTRRMTLARRAGTRSAAGGGSVPGPDSIEVGARHVRVGDWWAATLAVTGYPSEVGPGWLESLTAYPGRLDVSLHIEPVPPAVAAERLRKQRARLESGAAPMPAKAAWMTLTPRPPPRTPASWPTGSPAARGTCSAPGCT